MGHDQHDDAERADAVCRPGGDKRGRTSTLATGVFDNVVVEVPATNNQPPTVTLTAPTNGAPFIAPASIGLAATASDTDGTIAQVTFFNGTTPLTTDTSAPYAFTWNGVAAGSYSLTAVAQDNAGATTTSAAQTVTVTPALPLPNPPPEVTLTGPANGAVYTAPATIPITADASDANGTVTVVEFYNGTTMIGSDSDGALLDVVEQRRSRDLRLDGRGAG